MKRLWAMILAMALGAMALGATADERTVFFGWVIQGAENHGFTVRYRDGPVESHLSWFLGDDDAVVLGLGGVTTEDIGNDFWASAAGGGSVVLNKSPAFNNKFVPWWRTDAGWWTGGDNGIEASYGWYYPNAGKTNVWGVGWVSDLTNDPATPVTATPEKPEPEPEPEPEPDPDPDFNGDCKPGNGFGDENNCHEKD